MDPSVYLNALKPGSVEPPEPDLTLQEKDEDPEKRPWHRQPEQVRNAIHEKAYQTRLEHFYDSVDKMITKEARERYPPDVMPGSRTSSDERRMPLSSDASPP